MTPEQDARERAIVEIEKQFPYTEQKAINNPELDGITVADFVPRWVLEQTYDAGWNARSEENAELKREVKRLAKELAAEMEKRAEE